jgi:hypothetical protein
MRIIVNPIGCFIREPDGKVNKEADEEAFNAAIEHLNPAIIETEMGLILHERDASAFGRLGPRNAAFLGLLGASGGFVYSKGKFNAEAFDAALEGMTAEKTAAKMKEMKGPNASVAFDSLMRSPAP